jgi:hypothetical protein
METPAKRYLIIVRFGPEEPIRTRALKSVPEFVKIIERFAGKELQLAFTSRDGSTFGYLLKTSTPLRIIHRALFGEDNSPGTAALLRNDDFFAVEVGAEIDGRGFSRAWTWLQHH